MPEDARDFSVARRILRALNVQRVELLTANPAKIAALGSFVVRTRALRCAPNDANKAYLRDKAVRYNDLPALDGLKQTATQVALPDCELVAQKRVVIIMAQWHCDLLEPLCADIVSHLREHGVTNVRVCRVPGSFELAQAAGRFSRQTVDVVIVLGVLIKGETAHFDMLSAAATNALAQLSIGADAPFIVDGLLGCFTKEQARQRCVGAQSLARSLANSALCMAAFEQGDARMAGN